MKLVLLAAAAALTLTAAAPRDWSRTVINTPTGWRAGNPAAPVKLVEYGSLNCPHCAHFSQAADEPIMERVKTGRVSFEYRPYLIFPHDVAASLVARCVPLSRRFEFTRDYYRNTGAMTERLRSATRDPAQKDALEAAQAKGVGPYNQRVAAITGIGQLASRYGLAPAATNRCVSDPAALAWLQKAQTAAKAAGVTGTPTYQLNGQPLKPASPEELLAALK